MGTLEKRIRLAYAESYNVKEIDARSGPNKLVQAFEGFEKTDDIGDMSPATARRSRWVLIYSILQSLASVSVDDERVQYSDKVDYHLSPRLEGVKIPPWKRGASENIGNGAHERSYCWIEERKQKEESDEYDDDVDLSLITDLDLPIQLNTDGADGGRSTEIGGPNGTDMDTGPGFSPALRERTRIRRGRDSESPVVTDYLYT